MKKRNNIIEIKKNPKRLHQEYFFFIKLSLFIYLAYQMILLYLAYLAF